MTKNKVTNMPDEKDKFIIIIIFIEELSFLLCKAITFEAQAMSRLTA